jgi:hypothetical protein
MTTQCNLTSYEATMFFEPISTNGTDYADDFWFAGYCLATEFFPQSYIVSDLEYDTDFAECRLQKELISGCSYLNNYYRSTAHLYNDLAA